VDKKSISVAGDPFYAAAVDGGDREQVDTNHLCYEGVVYMGREVPLPDGEVEIEYVAYPCRRCAESKKS
jgi:hypothetical protein